jgi:hypothetical protein
MLDITADDRLAIHDVIALHGHVADDRDWDRLGDLFTDDAVLDLEDFGYGTLHGLQAIRDLSRGSQDDKGQPLGIMPPTSLSSARTAKACGRAQRRWRSWPTGRAEPLSMRTYSGGRSTGGASATGRWSRGPNVDNSRTTKANTARP